MSDKARNRLLLVLFVGVLMGALDIAIVGPALPTIRDFFGVDDRAAAWIFSIYVLFNLVSTPLMAKLSDLYGRRSIYIMDVAIFAAGSLVVAAAPSFAILLAGRAIQGVGAGGIFPVASAVIGDTFPPEKRGSALGLIGAVFGLAFIIGPIIGGILLLAGWRWLFLINLPIAALVVAMGWRVLPTTRREGRLPFDWLGMLTLGVALASLAFGINRIDTKAFGDSLASIQVWPFLVLALALLVVFYLIERRAADPIVRPHLLGNGQLRLANLIAAGAGLGEAGLVFIPALAIAAFGMSSSTSSFMLMPVVLALAVGSPMVGRLLDKVGSKVVIVAGAALLAAGMLLLSLSAANLALFILAGVVIGLGLSALLGAPTRYIVLNEAPAEDRGAAQGVLTVFTGVGQLIAGALVGAVAASAGGGVQGYGSAYMVVAVVALVLTLLAFGLKGRAAELAAVQANTGNAA
jgi:EmrB/QacA subfamily drug resistance transporter